jgi:hypothetical protein
MDSGATPGLQLPARVETAGGRRAHALGQLALDPGALLLPQALHLEHRDVGIDGQLGEDVNEDQLGVLGVRELTRRRPRRLGGLGEVGRAENSLEHRPHLPGTLWVQGWCQRLRGA